MRTILTMAVAALVPALQARADELEIPITARDFPPITKGPGFTDQPRYQRQGPNIVFVNFAGADMQSCGWGNDDPHNDCSSLYGGIVDPYSGDASQQAAVVQAVRADLAAYNMKVTTTRPAPELDYDMEMVGNWNPPADGTFAGIAPSVDCFNGSGGEVSFTLEHTSLTPGIAKTILQELAHTWGLEHVDDQTDLLYPTTAGFFNPSFTDVCSTIVDVNDYGRPIPTNGIACGTQHSAQCGQATQQNSHKELLGIFGPAIPDVEPPGLTIVVPADGATVPGSFDLVLLLEDTESPVLYIVTIEVVGQKPFVYSYPGPGELVLPVSLGVGTQTLKVTVEDELDNAASDEVTIHVGAAGEGGSGDGTSSVEGSGAGTGGAEASDDGSGNSASDGDGGTNASDGWTETGADSDSSQGTPPDSGRDEAGSDAGLVTASDWNDHGDDNGCACNAHAVAHGTAGWVAGSWPALFAFAGWPRRRPDH